MDLTNSKAAFIGIDVSCAKRKRIPIVFAVKEKNRLVLTGFEIVEKLKDFCTVIEVYLQATIREILPNVFHKTKRGVAEEQLNAIAQFTGWPTTEEENEISYISAGSLHDKVDSYSAAWVASLSEDERDVYGDISKNDAIHIPAKHLTQNQPAISPILGWELNTKSTPSDMRKVCPACKNFEFKRWPLGWDSHSAHKCSAAVGDTPEERKRWYKSRFLMR